MVNPENLLLDSHPLGFVSLLRERYGDSLVLGFSKYRYSPRSRYDDRVRFQIAISDVTLKWCADQIASLDSMQELALESRVVFGGKIRHIPMLDFRGMTRGQLAAIMGILPRSEVSNIAVYLSGRSYHAYFQHLLTHSGWVKFMGSALLCNTPSDSSVVDQRWVGHRLISGYSALRWSCNTPHYKAYPVKVEASELDLAYYDKKSQYLLKAKPGNAESASYFEGLVGWALERLGVSFSRHLGGVSHLIDFFVEDAYRVKVGIKLVLSISDALPSRALKDIDKYVDTIFSEFDLDYLVLISNASFSKVGTAPHFMDRRVVILDNVGGPQDLLSRLGSVF